jgi:signal transduction histidine kinase
VIHLDLTDVTKRTSGFDGTELLKDLNYDFGSPAEESGDPTVIVPFRVYEHADYSLEGTFDTAGNFSGQFTNFRGDGLQRQLAVSAPPMEQDQTSCGPASVKINVYDRENDAVENLFRRMGINFDEIGIRAARKILTDNSGIAMYREGFRIRPYGEPENDWLELETQRVQNPSKKLGISQVSGRVDIGSESDSHLIERSSREGLEHNGAFDRLKKLIQGVLVHVEERRLDFREKAGLSRRSSGDVSVTKSLASLPEIRKEAARAPLVFRDRLDRAIEKDSAALSASLEELDAYQKLLQSRAALGLVVAQVIHEGRRILNPLAEAARALNEDSGQLLEQSKLGDLARKHLPDNLKAITSGVRELSRLIKRLDPISGRRRGSPRNFEIKEAVLRSLELFDESLKAKDISVELVSLTPMTAYGYQEDVQAAVMNILENAIYWISSVESSDRVIAISSKKSKNTVSISISNSGPEIDASYIPRLFNAGFSLRSAGTGLGLAIAREACRASKGDLAYDETKDLTTFVVTVPAGRKN